MMVAQKSAETFCWPVELGDFIMQSDNDPEHTASIFKYFINEEIDDL